MMKKLICAFLLTAVFPLPFCSCDRIPAETSDSTNENLKSTPLSTSNINIDGITYADAVIGRAIAYELSELFPNQQQTEEMLLAIKTLGFFGEYDEFGNEQEIDLVDIPRLINLEHLSVYDCYIRDISPLNQLSYLRKLSTLNTIVSNVAALRDMKSLEEVCFIKSQIDSWDFIRGAKNLRILDIGDAWFTSDSSLLAELKDLEELVALCAPIEDISVLRNLTKLRKLYCVANESDIPVLMELKQLEVLYISDSGTLEMIEQLQTALPNTEVSADYALINAADAG